MDTTSNTEQPKRMQPKRKSQPKLWTRTFVLIVAITFFAFIVGQGLNTGMSVYIDHIGGTATFAGVLSTVFSAAAAVARIAIGPAIDARGRQLVMVGGMAALALGTIVPALFPAETPLIIGRVLQGAGFAAATTAAATAAADVLPPERMGEGIGYSGLGQALAMSIGPAFALFLIGTDPAENLFFVLAAIAAANMVISLACRYERHPDILPKEAAYRRKIEQARASRTRDEESSPSANSAQSATRHRGVFARIADRIFEPHALPGTIPILFLSAAFGFSIVFSGLYGTSLGIENVGLFYTCSAVSMIVVRLKSKAFMDTVLPIKVFTVAIVCGLAAFGMLLAAPTAPILFYLAGFPYGVCLGISLPLNQSVVVKNTPPERWGAGNALYLLANDIGIGVAAAIWGITNDTFGFSVTLLCAMGCIVVSYVLAWIAYPADAKRSTPVRANDRRKR